MVGDKDFNDDGIIVEEIIFIEIVCGCVWIIESE
jgi:hypothetical protein